MENSFEMEAGGTISDEKNVEKEYESNIYEIELEEMINLDEHEEAILFKCDLCDKVFTNSRSLKTHRLSVHFQEKKYQCDDCDKRFGLSSDLKKHRQTVHYQEKKY